MRLEARIGPEHVHRWRRYRRLRRRRLDTVDAEGEQLAGAGAEIEHAVDDGRIARSGLSGRMSNDHSSVPVAAFIACTKLTVELKTTPLATIGALRPNELAARPFDQIGVPPDVKSYAANDVFAPPILWLTKIRPLATATLESLPLSATGKPRVETPVNALSTRKLGTPLTSETILPAAATVIEFETSSATRTWKPGTATPVSAS